MKNSFRWFNELLSKLAYIVKLPTNKKISCLNYSQYYIHYVNFINKSVLSIHSNVFNYII